MATTGAQLPEPWLRGTLTEVPAVIRAVLHALELAREDAERWCGELTGLELNTRPMGLPPVAFHLRHISGSVDRLLTYAEGRELSEEQVAEMKREAEPAGALPRTLLLQFGESMERAAERIRAFAGADLEAQRFVGRKRLPTTCRRPAGARCRSHAAAYGADGDDGEIGEGFVRALFRLSPGEEVAHARLLGFEVALGERRCGRDFGGDALDDANACSSSAAIFSGLLVMRRTACTSSSLSAFAGKFEDAAVGLVAELEVGLDGVEALVLQLVGAELGHQADAAAFLLLVDQDAGAFVGDALHRELELLAAVAAERAEDIAGEALRVDADEGGAAWMSPMTSATQPSTRRQGGGSPGRQGSGSAMTPSKPMDAEMSPAGGEVGLRYLADRDGGHA